MSNESHPSPTGSSSSSLFGGGGSNTAGVSGTSPHPSPSKPTWAQILNSNPNNPSNTSTSTTPVTANSAATASTTGNNTNNNKNGGGGGAASNSSSSSSPSCQQTTTFTSAAGGAGGGENTQTAGASTTRSISPSQVTTSNSGAFNFPGSRTGVMPNMYDQQQQSQMNWPLNFNQTSSSWMVDDDTQGRSNLAGSSSQQSVDSNRNTPGGGDGFDRLESSSPTSDWGKPVNTSNSAANGWSNFQQQQQQQTVNNPSRSSAVGGSNTPSNQWPEMNNFYATNSSNNVPFNLPQSNSDNMNNTNTSSTWQDPSLSGNNNDGMGLALGGINSSVINKHKSSSSSSMAASLTGALKSAIAMGGANVDLSSGNGDPAIVYVPQPKLVEQLGWDEPEIKIIKRGNFDDGTSIWGDPMESVAVPVKKWTNGTKAALSNSTNIILQQQPAVVQKNAPTNMQTSNSATSNSQMVLNDENWPKQQSPTLPQQTTSQWNDTPTSMDQAAAPPANPAAAYRTQQSLPANWNPQIPPSSHHAQDDWFRDGVVDTSDWGLQGSQSKVPFDPYEGQVDTSGWGVQGGASGGMGGPLSMPPMNRNRFMSDYDPNENPHDPHGMHRMASYESQTMGDLYRQGSDLKNPIIGLGGLLPASANNPSHHMLPPNQLPFAPRPGPIYQQNNMIRPMAPNAIPTSSGAIMGTGSLISPKLSTTSPVPNQAPYVPLAAKQSNMPPQPAQTPTSQQPQQPGTGGPVNNGAVQAQIMQQFRLAVQAGLISQDLLNTKLPPYMLQLLQKLFELQQKFQALTIQLADFSKHKQRFPITFFQTEYERLSKAITQKKQEMLIVQKQIQEAHAKLVQQSGAPTPTPSQMMANGPVAQNQSAAPPGVSSTQSQDQLAERMQQSLNVDQSRLHQWTKQQTSSRGGQSSSSMFGPPGLTQKDWQASGNNSNENWENTQTNDSSNNNQADPHAHNSQAGASSSTFGDALSEFVDDTDGPPPFVPGQLWNWKSSLPNAEDDPHVTPSSLTMGPKGPSSSMSNLNVGGSESAFSNPQLLHQMHRQQANRSQWQQTVHDQQGFQPSMNDWGKPHQFRGTSKLPPSLNHPPPPPHASFGGYRPYM